MNSRTRAAFESLRNDLLGRMNRIERVRKVAESTQSLEQLKAAAKDLGVNIGLRGQTPLMERTEAEEALKDKQIIETKQDIESLTEGFGDFIAGDGI